MCQWEFGREVSWDQAYLAQLHALEAVEEDLADSLLKVQLQSAAELEKQVGIGAAGAAVGSLFVVVGVDDVVGGGLRWQRHKKQGLGDILPVIDEKGLELIGD